MDSTRLPPSTAAQRVALRAALSAFCAGGLATVEALVSPEEETGRFGIAAHWAVFGAAVLGVGAGEWLEQRHALWRVATRDRASRTGS